MSPTSQPIRLPAKPGRLVPLRFLETTDSLRIVAGAARRPAFFPQLFPIPDPGRHLGRQRESELMREHTHLPAMMGFVRKHVAQHFQANRPRPSPAISAKLLDAAPTTADSFEEIAVNARERRSWPTPASLIDMVCRFSVHSPSTARAKHKVKISRG